MASTTDQLMEQGLYIADNILNKLYKTHVGNKAILRQRSLGEEWEGYFSTVLKVRSPF
jgi:hypothetical protein